MMGRLAALRGGDRWHFAVGAVVVVLLVSPLVLPSWLFGASEMSLLIRIFVLMLFATSTNILLGYSGMLTLGQATFYGVGAYVLVFGLNGTLPLPVNGYFASVVASLIVVGAVAAVIGFISVQKGDFYFALLTLAFSMLIYQVATQWRELTRGGDGLIFPSASINLGFVTFGVTDTQPYYLFTVVVVIVCLLALWYVTKTPLGELFLAIRENAERARFVGVRVKFVKWLAFMVGAVFAGVAGILIAPANFVVSPSLLHWLKSADPILVILIGGPYVFVGPIVGAGVFMALEAFLTPFTSYWRVALGAILIVMVIYFPGGIAGYLLDDETSVFDALEQYR
jgi:branched-chain amino acid transport system permease protein